jgi:hypothetical protein
MALASPLPVNSMLRAICANDRWESDMPNNESDPPGFERYPLYRNEYSQALNIFVPASIKETLVENSRRRFKEEEAARDDLARIEKAREIELAVKRLKASKTPDPSPEKTTDQIRDDKAGQAWKAIDHADELGRSRLNYPVFKSDQAIALLRSLGKGDSEERSRLDRVYQEQELLQRGTTRRDIALPNSLKPLQVLAQKQPHMKEVVNFVIAQMNLTQSSRKPARLQPMLLVGEAGVGKTHFVQALAQALATTVHTLPLDNDLTSSIFLGSDRKWSNSQQGMLFDAVVMGQYANPIVVLDELDKCQRSMSYSSPVTSLYRVLEPLSAKGVRDISLSFEFDASQVTWIATANNAVLLDQPLRSRFREFHIMPPSASECLVLAGEVMRAAIESVGIKGFKADVSLRRHLAHLPARQISQLTLEALANAVAAGRKALRLEDLPKWLQEDELDGQRGSVTSYLH